MPRAKIVSTLSLAASLCCAAAAWAGGASGDRVPTYIEVTTDGAIIIEASPPWDNPDGCLNPARIYIPATNPVLDRFYAATLTAYAGRDLVWAWLDGCQLMGWGEEYPVVKNLATRAR